MRDHHSNERRTFYRKTIRKAMEGMNSGKEVTPLSLNQLEEAYMLSRQKAARRKAKKATA